MNRDITNLPRTLLAAGEIQLRFLAAPTDLHLDLERRAGGAVEQEGLVDAPLFAEEEPAIDAPEQDPLAGLRLLPDGERGEVARDLVRGFGVLRAGEGKRHQQRIGRLAGFALADHCIVERLLRPDQILREPAGALEEELGLDL